jgi:hypothetical protein
MGDVYVYKNRLWKPHKTFSYTGDVEEFSLTPGKYLFICKGAKGGTFPDSNKPPAPIGGTSYGILDLQTDKTFYAAVGGDGGVGTTSVIGAGGWNGGADGGKSYSSSYKNGCGGGGASDVRLTNEGGREITVQHQVPDWLTEVEYIRSDGTQYLDTGITGSSDISFEMRFTPHSDIGSSNYGTIFASNSHSSSWLRDSYYLTTWGNSSYTPISGVFAYGNAGIPAHMSQDEDTTMSFANNVLTVNGDDYSVSPKTFSSGCHIYLFAANYNGTAKEHSKVSVRYLKLSDPTGLKRFFVPFVNTGTEIDVSNVQLSQGSINSTTQPLGEDDDDSSVYSKRIRSQTYVPIDPAHKYISVSGTASTNLEMLYIFYDSDQQFLSYHDGWVSSESKIKIPSQAHYFRFVIRKANDSTISVSDITSFGLKYYESTVVNGLYDLVNDEIHGKGTGNDFTVGDPVQTKTIYNATEIIDIDLWSRIIVAGGGGGGSYYTYSTTYLPSHFGVGGGALGGAVGCYDTDQYYDMCADQTSGYSFGVGMTPPDNKTTNKSYNNEGSGGGGGGWFGGYSTERSQERNTTSGGGGSGYVVTSSSYKPQDYVVDPDVLFTDICMMGGTAEQAGVIICKETRTMEAGDKLIFPLVGWMENIELPVGEYTFKCTGGDGGTRYTIATVARGGYAEGSLAIDVSTPIFVRVGGSGLRYSYDYNQALLVNPALAFNGGGAAGDPNDYRSTFGGGATDIRIVQDTLNHRLIVAGGAGGHGSAEAAYNRFGGAGGGTSGLKSNSIVGTVPGPGTQTESPANERVGGGFGYGGSGVAENGGFGGAGGSGWFGGSGCIPNGDTDNDAGGCGGSGYVLTAESYKPDGYALGSEYYLSDTYMAANDVNHYYGIAKAEILVSSVNYMSFICKDEEGLKYFDKTTETWTFLSDGYPTEEDFIQYGASRFYSDAGLLNNYTVYVYDPQSTGFTDAIFKVLPTEQQINVVEYTPNLLKKIIIDADIDTETTNFEVSAVRKGVAEDARIEFTIKAKLNDIPKFEPRLYSITTQTQGEISYHEPEKKEKTIEHIDLLPVGSSTKVPSNNRSYIGGYIDAGQEAITSVESGVCCEHNRMIYCATLCNNRIVRFTKLNLLTNQISIVKDIPKSSMGGSSVYYGGLLADDDYLYIAASNQSFGKTIWRVPIDPNDNTIQPLSPGSDENFTAYGKMVWLDDHTIVINYNHGFYFYDTIRQRWTQHRSPSMNETCGDFAVGKRFILTLYNGNSQTAWVYDMSTDAWYSFKDTFGQWTLNARNCCCYADGKFYVTQMNYIYIINEDTIAATVDDGTPFAMRTVPTPYQSLIPRTMDYENGALYITITKSPTLYVYDVKADRFTATAMGLTMNDWGYSDNFYRPFTFKGFFFVANFKLYVANFTDYAKYNLGYKYDQFVIITNAEYEERFTYDERFVEFRDSYMIVRIGDITYPLIPYSTEEHISTFNVNKTEYDKIISVKLVTNKEEEDEDEPT